MRFIGGVFRNIQKSKIKIMYDVLVHWIRYALRRIQFIGFKPIQNVTPNSHF